MHILPGPSDQMFASAFFLFTVISPSPKRRLHCWVTGSRSEQPGPRPKVTFTAWAGQVQMNRTLAWRDLPDLPTQGEAVKTSDTWVWSQKRS